MRALHAYACRSEAKPDSSRSNSSANSDFHVMFTARRDAAWHGMQHSKGRAAGCTKPAVQLLHHLFNSSWRLHCCCCCRRRRRCSCCALPHNYQLPARHNTCSTTTVKTQTLCTHTVRSIASGNDSRAQTNENKQFQKQIAPTQQEHSHAVAKCQQHRCCSERPRSKGKPTDGAHILRCSYTH